MNYRVGIGYDIHRLVEGRALFLGGVEIPYHKGFLGHSDGDALLHAVCDALLGAAALGDIGEHFPDTDPLYYDIQSSKLLAQVGALLKERGYRVHNIDAVVVAQEPVLAPFKKKMAAAIAGILSLQEDQVNVKAKTNEGLDALGRKEAIAVYVTASIVREG